LNDVQDGDRVLVDLHGVNIEVLVTGELGWFDPTTLLIVATTSVTLIFLSDELTDFFALRVLPALHKSADIQYWSELKEMTTKYFSEDEHSRAMMFARKDQQYFNLRGLDEYGEVAEHHLEPQCRDFVEEVEKGHHDAVAYLAGIVWELKNSVVRIKRAKSRVEPDSPVAGDTVADEDGYLTSAGRNISPRGGVGPARAAE
jgi:hypothetical protein